MTASYESKQCLVLNPHYWLMEHKCVRVKASGMSYTATYGFQNMKEAEKHVLHAKLRAYVKYHTADFALLSSMGIDVPHGTVVGTAYSFPSEVDLLV